MPTDSKNLHNKKEPVPTRAQSAEYIAELARELSTIAVKTDMLELTRILDAAVAEAERNSRPTQ